MWDNESDHEAYIREACTSNLGTDYHDGSFRGLARSLKANARIVPQIRP
jgi:hypothetical protein